MARGTDTGAQLHHLEVNNHPAPRPASTPRGWDTEGVGYM